MTSIRRCSLLLALVGLWVPHASAMPVVEHPSSDVSLRDTARATALLQDDVYSAYELAMKAEALLQDFAAQAARRWSLAGQSVRGDRRVPGGAPRDPQGPANQGNCLACPSFDFGPFSPTPTWQYHPESTDAAGDCNTYAFNLIAGNTYEFSLCASDGALASWDARLRLLNPQGCALLAGNDDTCGLQPRMTWTATYTGQHLVTLDGFRGSSSGDFGPYMLAYRATDCSGCTSPLGSLTMTTSCQVASGSISSDCPALFWRVFLSAGKAYEFSTCPATCSGTSCTTIPDTFLELYSPSTTACTSAIGDRVASNDDMSGGCAGRPLASQFTYIPSVSGAYVIKARSVGTALGTMCMSYRELENACPNTCASGPFVAVLTPTAVCQTHSSAIVSPCIDTWYVVNALAAGPHQFSLCPGACLGTSVSFDSVIEFYNNACTLLASDDDSCGAPRSDLILDVPTPGLYRLRIRSATGSPGTYSLAYRAISPPCVAPSAVTIRPPSGTAGPALNTCSVTQSFTVTAAGSPPMAHNWIITPPAGGAAAPASGSVAGGPSVSNQASFSSIIVREGVFGINVVATNACGNAVGSSTYQLRDLTPPVFTSFPPNTTLQCNAVPPPPTLSASDNCDPNPVESFSEVITPGRCPGIYTITRTWAATDRSGNVSAPRSQVLSVVDRRAPVIVPDTTVKHCLYPPNHALGCFLLTDFTPVITDACSPPITWRFAGVLNSEAGFPGPCPPGDIDPDIIIAPDGSSICVRSERCSSDPAVDDGRTYLVLATATDACGNTSQPTSIGAILVPHDSADTSNCIAP